MSFQALLNRYIYKLDGSFVTLFNDHSVRFWVCFLKQDIDYILVFRTLKLQQVFLYSPLLPLNLLQILQLYVYGIDVKH
jgi:hypothetical protein